MIFVLRSSLSANQLNSEVMGMTNAQWNLPYNEVFGIQTILPWYSDGKYKLKLFSDLNMEEQPQYQGWDIQMFYNST